MVAAELLSLQLHNLDLLHQLDLQFPYPFPLTLQVIQICPLLRQHLAVEMGHCLLFLLNRPQLELQLLFFQHQLIFFLQQVRLQLSHLDCKTLLVLSETPLLLHHSGPEVHLHLTDPLLLFAKSVLFPLHSHLDLGLPVLDLHFPLVELLQLGLHPAFFALEL